MNTRFLMMFSAAVLLLSAAACKKEYALGDTGPAGGIIFYDDEADGRTTSQMPGI